MAIDVPMTAFHSPMPERMFSRTWYDVLPKLRNVVLKLLRPRSADVELERAESLAELSRL
ncbi:hypothetical protein D3C83_201940 [compost metagenome]